MSDQLIFPSLDFGPDRKTLYAFEVAAKLGLTEQHVLDLIDEGALEAINLAGVNNKSTRRTVRIPVEAYRKFVNSRRIQPATKP